MRNQSVRFSRIFVFIAAIAFCGVQDTVAASSGAISQLLASSTFTAGGATVKTGSVAPFYRDRSFAPVWVSTNGISPQAERALEVLAHADADGLNPKNYHTDAIASLRTATDTTTQSKLDVMISHAILQYANDLRYGRDTAERRETYGTKAVKASVDILNQVAKSTPENVAPLLASYAPPLPEYAGLKRELQRYKQIAANGGIPQLAYYRILQRNDNVPAVSTLRHILTLTGDLKANSGSTQFDAELEQAVKQFQKRNGIGVDGVVGRETRQLLSTPAEMRIRALIATMERLRWSPESLGSKYVIVNLPGYQLRAVRPGAEDLTMRIIVGKAARQTPTFVRTISQVVFNPTWTVPPRIAAEDILPDIKKYTEFFQRNNFKLLRYKNAHETYEVDPKSINWDQVTQSNFQWTLFQPPGELNPLGRVKFFIPNSPQVYMHDTPRKNLFSDADRNLSSGCIRLELPKSFADYVLADEKGWTTERVYKTFDTTKKTSYVPVRNQPKLYFVYWTATLGSDGLVYFHEDIYGRDKALLNTLI